MYQLKGFSRLVIGFDVHSNKLCGLDSSVCLCAVTCLATFYASILQSIQVKLDCGIFDF